MNKGYEKGEINMFLTPSIGKSMRFLPKTIDMACEMGYSVEVADKITNTGKCIINETIDRLKEHGIDTSFIIKNSDKI